MAGRKHMPAAPTITGLVGPLEHEVLRALWEGGPAHIKAIVARVNSGRQPRLAYTTVLTVVSRMFEKDLLDRRREGRGFVYSPRYKEPELIEALGRREVDRLVDRYGVVALTQFAERLRQTDPSLLRRIAELRGGDV